MISDSSINSNEPVDDQTKSIEPVKQIEQIDESLESESTVISIGIESKQEPNTDNKLSQEKTEIITLTHDESSNEITSPNNDNLINIINDIKNGTSLN